MNRTNVSHLNCYFLSIDLDQTKDTIIIIILTCILNVVFSLLTFAGNFIVLHVIWKKQELHSPSFILLFCLAASDLLVGLICQPFSFVAYKIAELADNFGVYCVLRMIQNISGFITSGVTLTILTGISVDRLLALTLHLRYNTIVTVQRILQTVAVFWILSVTIVVSKFWIRKWIIFPVVIVVTSILATTVSTLKTFQIVRRHQRQISQQQQSVQITTVNVLKCRKSAVTVLYVYGLFLLFYVPFSVTMLVGEFSGNTLSLKIAYNYVTTILYLNSLLNPFVYCWRIKQIRGAIKKTLGKN